MLQIRGRQIMQTQGGRIKEKTMCGGGGGYRHHRCTVMPRERGMGLLEYRPCSPCLILVMHHNDMIYDINRNSSRSWKQLIDERPVSEQSGTRHPLRNFLLCINHDPCPSLRAMFGMTPIVAGALASVVMPSMTSILLPANPSQVMEPSLGGLEFRPFGEKSWMIS